MSEEEKTETTDQETPEAEEPQAEADEAAEAPAAEEAPADEPAAAEAPVEEPEAEEPAAEEPTPEPEADPATPGGEAEEADGGDSLTPKQKRKLERAQYAGEALPQRSAEQRAAERAERRSSKAVARRRGRARARAKHQAGEGTPRAERVEGTKAVRQGTVVSSQADKTITVRLDVVRRHPRYEKIVRQSSTVHAHDEANEANEGDLVRVIESRPLSRSKRWRLVEVLEKAR